MTAPEPTGITDRTVELWTAGQQTAVGNDNRADKMQDRAKAHRNRWVGMWCCVRCARAVAPHKRRKGRKARGTK